MSAAVARLWRYLFLRHWEALNEGVVRPEAPARIDLRPTVTLLVAALVLWFQFYFGRDQSFAALFAKYEDDPCFALYGWGWRTGTKVLAYLVVPAVTIKLLGGSLADHGLRLRGAAKHLWIYALLYLGVLPLIVAASYTRPFLATYPFYKLAARSWVDLIAWELMYGAMFVSIEFFFRGYLLFSLKKTFGASSIFVMLIPYCMIHFQKPPTEALGAIGAGMILGTLALATGSIWCGVLIHLCVAWSMDLLAILHVTGLPTSWRP